MSEPNAIERWRAAYEQRRWAEAVERFLALDRAGVTPRDFERAATVMMLVGRPRDATELLTLGHEAYRCIRDAEGTARTAAWNSLCLIELDEQARAAGWARRAVDVGRSLPVASPARALAFLPGALAALYAGRVGAAEEGFRSAFDIARRSGDADTIALGRLGLGQVEIMRGRTAEGVSLLDEAMVAVTAGEVSPIPSGIIYCAVISYCRLVSDLQRASEWTAALDRWCAEQPTMVAYSGQCHAHRAELLRLHGRWDEALACAEEAVRRVQAGDIGAAFAAHYQRGELLRLRGRFDEAAAAYREAGRSGWEPQPGLALLLLAEGDCSHAQDSLRRAAAVADPATKRSLLPAVAEVELAAGDIAAARAACDELREFATTSEAPLLHARLALAEGSVLRADGDGEGALERLSAAERGLRRLAAPYDAARCGMQIADVLHELGDSVGARQKRAESRATLDRLGAARAPDTSPPGRRASGRLSPREGEVVALVATGMTNREIAEALSLSEKTVARHLENIYTKLDVPSRAAATAWAVTHNLV